MNYLNQVPAALRAGESPHTSWKSSAGPGGIQHPRAEPAGYLPRGARTPPPCPCASARRRAGLSHTCPPISSLLVPPRPPPRCFQPVCSGPAQLQGACEALLCFMALLRAEPPQAELGEPPPCPEQNQPLSVSPSPPLPLPPHCPPALLLVWDRAWCLSPPPRGCPPHCHSHLALRSRERPGCRAGRSFPQPRKAMGLVHQERQWVYFVTN